MSELPADDDYSPDEKAPPIWLGLLILIIMSGGAVGIIALLYNVIKWAIGGE